MYFQNRRQAGEQLAVELLGYRRGRAAVLALSAGGVAVAEPIAKLLKAPLSLLVVEPLKLPGVGDVGSIDQVGNVVFGGKVPMAVIEEYRIEMREYLEEEKLHKLHEMSGLLGARGIADAASLRDQDIIIVSDGLDSGLVLEAAAAYIKPVKTGKIVGAVGVASVPAVDKLHIFCDEIYVLNVAENFLGISHYYQDDDVPDAAAVEKILSRLTVGRR